MPANSHIYVLRDPRDGSVKYVGQTVRPKERLRAHMADASKGCQYHSHRWIRTLVAAGLKPLMEIIEHTTCEQVDAAEVRWIAHYRSLGCNLTNHTDGGGGFHGFTQSPEQIAKRVKALTGKKRSGVALENLRAGFNNPDLLARRSALSKGNKSRSGQTQSEEERKKRADAMRGKKRTPEQIEKMRLAATGRTHTEEAKRRMSETKRATITAERRAEIARTGNLAMQEKRKCRSAKE